MVAVTMSSSSKDKLSQEVDDQRLYFQEVDAFELMEESPSPTDSTWIAGNVTKEVPLPSKSICTRSKGWLHGRSSNPSYDLSLALSKILDSPTANEPNYDCSSDFRLKSIAGNLQLHAISEIESESCEDIEEISESGSCEHMETGVKKLSLSPTSSFDDHSNPFAVLLKICGQSAPFVLKDLFFRCSGSETVVKAGEGTYGEAFKVGNFVYKIVPFDGDFTVNGEVQKTSKELLKEVLLSKTLSQLRGSGVGNNNICRTFIESEFRVCQGLYDTDLIQAWEDWACKHDSKNDHPKEFPEQQYYMVFVQQHGGEDLESFALRNFDEARTLLVQVAAGLAVAESAFEFEHRDLHWGNILVSRSDDSAKLQFTLDGKNLLVEKYGLIISIINCTLSRMNTGAGILYLDLSSVPDLFKGPKGDKQSETYRRMKVVTNDKWKRSFPKTNVLWLGYLVDILLTKKSFERTSDEERYLRSFKRSLENYGSAKDAINDPFVESCFV